MIQLKYEDFEKVYVEFVKAAMQGLLADNGDPETVPRRAREVAERTLRAASIEIKRS